MPSSAPACQRQQGRAFAATAAPADTTTTSRAAAGSVETEKGLVVLTREEGKNDKLRARLEGMQVRCVVVGV